MSPQTKKTRGHIVASHIKGCRSLLPYSDPIRKLVVQNGILCYTALKTKIVVCAHTLQWNWMA